MKSVIGDEVLHIEAQHHLTKICHVFAGVSSLLLKHLISKNYKVVIVIVVIQEMKKVNLGVLLKCRILDFQKE